MPRYNNYSLVADTSFNPYQSMQEMLVPFAAYKDAYEKQEALLDEINQNTDTFKYLEQVAKDNPESEAARIYNNYADELKRQAADFSANGLTMANRRSLSNLKRRYQGEIGLLDTASKAMEEEKKLRRQLGAKDHSMLYATDNLNIDDFLYGKTPNLYSVSGNELYTKGAALGKAASSRVYKAGDEGSVLGGYYRNWKESRGVSQESIADFMNSDAVQQEVDNMLRAEGVTGNLIGANYERARQQVLNGIYTGIVYEESNKPVRDAGVMSAAERAADSRARQSLQLQRNRLDYERKTSGITVNEDGTVTYDPTKDAAYQRMKKLSEEGGMGGYKFNPVTGKYGKDTESDAAAKKEQKAEDKKGEALMKLDRGTLANNGGFDVTFNNDRHHYDWMGALSKHGSKWYSGKKGDDNPGHWGWGFASTSNVENWWGNFTYEPGDDAKMRILSQSEIQSLMGNKEIAEHIKQQIYSSGYYNNAILRDLMKSQNITQEQAVQILDKNGYKYTNDIQIAAVNSERPNRDEENYLVAVRTK